MAFYDYFLQKFASNDSNYIGAKLSKILYVPFTPNTTWHRNNTKTLHKKGLVRFLPTWECIC